MCEDDRHDKLFKNSETIQRRAWIDLAVARVREHLGGDAAVAAPMGNAQGSEPATDVAEPRARRPRRPRLVLVRNDGSSG